MAFSDWSTTAGSNTSVGGVNIGEGMNPSDVNNAIRAVMADARAGLATQSTLAAATTTDLGSVNASTLTLTGGVTTITGLGTIAAGVRRRVISNAAHVLQYNGTSLITPSAADITLASGDVFDAESLGSGNWRICNVERISGRALIPSLISGTKQDSTSGTSIDFTGIPSGVKRIEVLLSGVSTNGTSIPLLQIGDSGGVETSGYTGCADSQASAGGVTTAFTAGMGLARTHSAAVVYHGIATLVLMDASTNLWAMTWIGSDAVTPLFSIASATKALSATLDRVRITTVNGTDAFDAGSINIVYQ